jgi:hypothetical protein
MDGNTTNELILNPSFVIPALYCSTVLNIVLIFIVVRLVGPLRRVLKKLGENSSIIIKSGDEIDIDIDDESDNNKQSIDKKEDLF